MNSIPEETCKKMKKRSRKKNKSCHNSFRTADDDEKSKTMKKGYKSCIDHGKPIIKTTTNSNSLNLELPSSPIKCKVPPNTERTSSSEISLLEVLEKGKKLRDAMVMSVLEDGENGLDEDLLLKLDQIDKETSSSCYQKLKSRKNGDLISPTEEKLINDYLEGKSMKEEDEILVLNTLHAEDSQQNLKSKSNDNFSQKPESSCKSSKNSPRSVSSGKSLSAIDSTSGFVTPDASNLLLKKINCLRLTIDSLTLTHSGKKKIIQAIDNKSKSYDEVPPPGATYFVECHFVDEKPRSQSQPWKSTPLRFCSRRQIENVIYFGQSSAHSLRPTAAHSLSTLQDELTSTNGLVCWRHLNQRVPALLGNFSLAGLLPQLSVETAATLAVTDPTHANAHPQTVLAHLKIKLQLGKDKLYFGLSLLDEPQNVVEVESSAKIFKEHCKKKNKECGGSARSGYKRHMKRVIPDPAAVRECLPDLDLPVCSNCNQYLILSHINEYDPMLCLSCYKLLSNNQVHFYDTIEFTIPKHFATKEQRHHAFLMGIDTVIGFPLFAGIEDGLSCYVDYKFPYISSGVRVEMCKTDTTSRVVSCEAQPSFVSVHRHTLQLPVVLPLSPLLAACSPGITLRLWLRYYKPSPRDHMVAMALLPMNELCLMELEFDKKQQKEAVTKKFELPLALVSSSVTSAYQQYNSLGCIRLTVTYSNHISHENAQNDNQFKPVCEDEIINLEEEDNMEEELIMSDSNKVKQPFNVNTLSKLSATEQTCQSYSDVKKESDAEISTNCTPLENIKTKHEELKAVKNRFWAGPFGIEGKAKHLKQDDIGNKLPPYQQDITRDIESLTDNIPLLSLNETNNISNTWNRQNQECSVPVMKEDFDVLAENLEQRFNQLQSELLKEQRKEMNEIDIMVKDSNINVNHLHDDIISLSSNSSMESLPFILGPPADFKDSQNITLSSDGDRQCSKSESEPSSSDTISGFLREDKDVLNFGSNDSFHRDESKTEPVKPKTFKAKVKIDRAVNLKAIKTGCNGKKGKVPPSTWVTFGTGDCCERNCGTADLICSGQRFSTPVIRRNYNPIWNLSWDIDLPIEYLQQVNKRLVFRVFEENLNAAFGFVSANLSILTSGLPCLSSWLSINDLSGACKGQIKIVVTPLEDVSKYQECSVFDAEEDDFEDSKTNKPEAESSQRSPLSSASFVASPTQIYINDGTSAVNSQEGVVDSREPAANADDEFIGDPFSADDIISDYKNTLENNFRNEMAGLENLIRFLRVGSMSNELSFLRATENKENLSSNPSSQQMTRETRTVAPTEPEGRYLNNRNIPANSQNTLQTSQRDKVLIDASTETTQRNDIPSSSTQDNSDDIISKLLQQISLFQPPSIKITDNMSQTVIPETKEKCTETTANSQCSDQTLHMKDASTETNDIRTSQLSQSDEDNDLHHVCSDLGSMLLQHFLTCRPTTVKVTDSSCQTESQEGPSVAGSAAYMRTQPLGMSTELTRDGGQFPLSASGSDHSGCDEPKTKNNRLIEIDNNIKDLELYLKNNMYTHIRTSDRVSDPKDGSSCGSLNGIMDSVPDCVNNISRSSSDIESLESFSQALFVPRETPDGENSGVVPTSDIGDSGTVFRRRNTFVIEKLKDKSEKLTSKNDQEDKDLV